MCGIVGILGQSAVATQVVEALKRLEYRGYDSAGVATLENGRLERRRSEGKLRNLEIKGIVGRREGVFTLSSVAVHRFLGALGRIENAWAEPACGTASPVTLH